MTKLLFLANIAWMKRYQGWAMDDKPERGGSHVRDYGYGHEVFNFSPWHGTLYGFVDIGRSRAGTPRSIRIERLGASPSDDSVSDVLVIWVATAPQGGRRIVGWYNHATVFQKWQEPPLGADRQIRGVKLAPDDKGVAGFCVCAVKEDCHLLRPDERVFEVPRNVMGQTNIGYAEGPECVEPRNRIVDYVRDMTGKAVCERQKYGSGGEGEAHRALKNRYAHDPAALGLEGVLRVPGCMEYELDSGDRADIVFEIVGGRYVAVEVEASMEGACTGAHQALKYKVLLCAQKGLPITSPQVEGILVAPEASPEVLEFCGRYGIRYVGIS